MLLGVQIVGILFVIGILYYTFLHYKRNDLSGLELLLWTILWILFGIVTLYPGILDGILETLSITRAMDLLTVLGFIFLVGLTFHNYLVVKKNKQKLETVVREVAVQKHK